MRTAIIPGSFDPITCGHIDLVRRAARLFDKIVVVAMVNEKKTYLFSPDERVEMMRRALSTMENVTVEFYGGMLYDYLRETGACAVVKGIRTPADTEYELEMANYNRLYYPQAETVLLTPRNGMEKISSSLVKQRCREGLPLAGYVDEHTENILRAKMEG